MFFFLVGLCVGSFLNVIISRGKLSALGGRSYCDHCKRQLFWWENIPIVSFLFLKGKCRSCRSPIPRLYPTVEFSTGIIFLLTYLYCQASLFHNLILSLLVASLLIFIFVFDARNKIIPDQAVGGLVILALMMGERHLLAGWGGAALLLFLHLVTRGKGMGLGDVKFAFFMGLFLGWPKIGSAFYIAFLTGGLTSAIMILLKKAKLKQQIAFGPFLVFGTLVSWWWGENIILAISRWLNF